MRHYLTFNGRSTHEFGIFISGESTYSAPERNVVSQEVPGRNGSLLFDMGNFKNISVKYPSYIEDELPSKIRDFLNYAGSQIGYQRLEDTYHPYEYRMARFKTNPSIDTAGYMNRGGKFTLEFDCKPQTSRVGRPGIGAFGGNYAPLYALCSQGGQTAKTAPLHRSAVVLAPCHVQARANTWKRQIIL